MSTVLVAQQSSMTSERLRDDARLSAQDLVLVWSQRIRAPCFSMNMDITSKTMLYAIEHILLDSAGCV